MLCCEIKYEFVFMILPAHFYHFFHVFGLCPTTYLCGSVGNIFHFMLSRIASLVNGHFVITFILLLSKKYENKINKVAGLKKAHDGRP